MSATARDASDPTATAVPRAERGDRAIVSRLLRFGLRLGAMVLYCVALIALWWLIVELFDINSLLVPGPGGVWDAMVEHSSLLISNTLYTVTEAMLGFVVATIVGVLLAVIIVSSPRISRALLPTLVAINSVPKVVVAPILVIWLGLGMLSKIGMAFLLAFFPIVISAVQGLTEVEPNLVSLYRLMRSSRATIMRRVRLPHAVPYILSGMKISLPLAIIGAVIGEFVAARKGIGHQIVLAYSSFDTELVFAAVIAITVASVVLFELLSWVERRLLVWRPTSFESR